MRSIAVALLKIRALDGMNCEKIAKALDCSVDTIRNASNETGLLSFDNVARMVYLFPAQCESIRDLMQPPAEKRTIADRFNDLQREIDELRKVVGRAS